MSRIPAYGGLIATDSNATANAIAQRDANGDCSFHELTQAIANAGALLLGVATYTAAATISSSVTVVKLDATAAAFPATLPPVASSVGQLYLATKIDSTGNLPTVKGNGSELIVSPGVGAGANTYTQLSAQGAIAFFYCDGTVWRAGKLA